MGDVECVLVALPGPEPVELVDSLRRKHGNFEFIYYHVNPAEVEDTNASRVGFPVARWSHITMLITFNFLPPSIEDAQKLWLIHFISSGIDHIIESPVYANTSIILTTSSGCSSLAIAEWVILTALVHTRRYQLLYEQQKQRLWKPMIAHGDSLGADLAGRRLGVLGYGSIGRQVARVGKSMGMDVIAYTASPKETPEEREHHGYVVAGTGDRLGVVPGSWYSGSDKQSLHNFLRQDIDVLVVCVPSTGQTEHLLGPAEFELLGQSRRPPFLSNVSRGSTIDQNALILALEAGQLCGAALDVADPEPLPEKNPLWDAPNVIITPHVSGVGGVGYLRRVFGVFEENLERMGNGEALINEIDRKKGY